jgi:hypothetical protein
MLDITMQPLIQPISSQIIDSCFHFPERFCDFSCWRYPQELQLLHLKTSCHLNRVLGQIFMRKAKNGFECLKLIWSGTLCFWSRIGSRLKISHYIQPSNLSSALGIILYLCKFFISDIKKFPVSFGILAATRDCCRNLRC